MRSILVAIAGLILATPPAWGATVVYSDYATWAAAVGAPISTITFSSASGGPFPAGYTEGGVLFQGLSAGVGNGYLYAIAAGYCSASHCLVGPPTEAGALGSTDGRLRSTLPSAVTSVAMEVGAYTSAGDIPVWTFSNGDSYTGGAQGGGATFIGFISDTPFTYVDYHISVGSSGGDFTVMDTFYLPESATAVPEPTTLLLWGTMASGVALVLWRRGKRRAGGSRRRPRAAV